MTQTLRLAIEMQPKGTGWPVGVGVFGGDKLIGHLTIEQIKEIVGKWDAMVAEYKRTTPGQQ